MVRTLNNLLNLSSPTDPTPTVGDQDSTSAVHGAEWSSPIPRLTSEAPQRAQLIGLSFVSNKSYGWSLK